MSCTSQATEHEELRVILGTCVLSVGLASLIAGMCALGARASAAARRGELPPYQGHLLSLLEEGGIHMVRAARATGAVLLHFSSFPRSCVVPSAEPVHEGILEETLATTEENAEIPDEFLCPITGGRMVLPVLCTCSLQCGTCYDRDSITLWLSQQTDRQRKCPNTGLPLNETMLFPVRALREAIERWVQRHGEPQESDQPDRDSQETWRAEVRTHLDDVRAAAELPFTRDKFRAQVSAAEKLCSLVSKQDVLIAYALQHGFAQELVRMLSCLEEPSFPCSHQEACRGRLQIIRFLFAIIEGSPGRAQAVISHGVLPRFIYLLDHSATTLEADPGATEPTHTLEACAYFLRQLSFADSDNQAAIYRAGFAPLLIKLVASSAYSTGTREQAAFTLWNMFEVARTEIVEHGLQPALQSLTENPELDSDRAQLLQTFQSSVDSYVQSRRAANPALQTTSQREDEIRTQVVALQNSDSGVLVEQAVMALRYALRQPINPQFQHIAINAGGLRALLDVVDGPRMSFPQDQSVLQPDLSQQGCVQTLLCLRDQLVENRDAQLAAHAEGVLAVLVGKLEGISNNIHNVVFLGGSGGLEAVLLGLWDLALNVDREHIAFVEDRQVLQMLHRLSLRSDADFSGAAGLARGAMHAFERARNMLSDN